MGRAAVFIDRDGTLIEDTNYVGSVDEVIPIPRAAQGLARLTRADVPLYLVTNQSGVGRGYFPMSAVEEIHAHLTAVWGAAGARFEDLLVCGCRPDRGCPYRKPSPQFLIETARTHGYDLARSTMIGDSSADIGCGAAAGARTILVRTGKGRDTEQKAADDPNAAQPDLVVDDFAAAAEAVLLELARPSQ